tara:strand:- start:140 stop:1696 length:1557 start_codon:yes stop_codon:yes gene_type:complete
MGIKKNTMSKIKRALISVSNKKNLKPLLKILKKFKVKIVSSGGTYKKIKSLGFDCTEVSKFTEFPEILDGRVKTLHPKIHAGILCKRKNKKHLKDITENNLNTIDLVIVNFYPFEKTIQNTSNHDKIIENVDIGGPTMVRAAAKNYNDVTVITSINQYDELSNQLNKNKGSTTLEFRKKLSLNAFSETAYYDSLIANYFNKISNNYFPQKKIFHTNLIEKLRYGENPHQKSAIYSSDNSLKLKKLNGKQLSYNNFNDIYAALTISKSLPKETGVVIVKHSNPCGVSIIKDKIKCFQSALACDPISAFGGIVSCNFQINRSLALELSKIFLEVIIANKFDKDAIDILKKKKNLRLIDASDFSLNDEFKVNSFANAILFQNEDKIKFNSKDFKIVSKMKPNKEQMQNLIFAFNVCRYVKSNAIVLAHDKSIVGIGSGQPSRIDSCKIAIDKMKKFRNPSKNIVAASDAFFPFVDGIEMLVQSGVSAIIQPSGSINDKDIIKYANQTDTILIFSNTRHFRH